MGRKCIKADGIPLSASEKCKRYREKQKRILADAQRIITTIIGLSEQDKKQQLNILKLLPNIEEDY